MLAARLRTPLAARTRKDAFVQEAMVAPNPPEKKVSRARRVTHEGYDSLHNTSPRKYDKEKRIEGIPPIPFPSPCLAFHWR